MDPMGILFPVFFPEGEHRHSSRWRLPVSPRPCQELSLETVERKIEVLERTILPSLIDMPSLGEKKKEKELVSGNKFCKWK